jgi:DNA-binding GntR family transcriptional regulator
MIERLPLARPFDEDAEAGRIAAALEEDLLLGRLSPRERLVGDTLARRFGTNRNVVRRALAELERAGVLVILPNRGAQVRDFSLREIEELVETRAVLQACAAERIPLPAAAELVERLEGLHAAHATAVERRDLKAVYEHNRDFHDALFRAAGNGVMADAIARYSWLLTIIRSYRMADTASLAAGAAGHAEMLEALRDGDRPRLVAAVQAHIAEPRDIVARKVWHWGAEVVRL